MAQEERTPEEIEAEARASSQERVRNRFGSELKDPSIRHFFYNHGEQGRALERWLLMNYCQALVAESFHTAERRTLLEAQANIPALYFYDRMDLAEWLAIRPNKYYKIGTGWKPELVADMPSVSHLGEREVHKALNLYGHDSDEAHLMALEAVSETTLRKQQVVEWATREAPKASLHTYGNQGTSTDDRYLRRAASIFKGFVYATLHLALNPVNLADAKWKVLRENLLTWKNFLKRITDDNITAAYSTRDRFYDGTQVWLWDGRELFLGRVLDTETETVGDAAADLDAAAIPEFGLGKDHYIVKEILELRQPYVVHDATLSELRVIDQDENEIALTPVFASDTTAYTVQASATAVLEAVATPTHAFADVEITASVAKYSIVVTSQDKEVRKVYTITVNRTGG